MVFALAQGSGGAAAGGARAPAARAAVVPKWEVRSVDSGAIRSFAKATAADEDFVNLNGGNARDVATNRIYREQVDALQKEGYEPFAANAYGGTVYNNETIVFYRKRVN